MDIIGMLQKLQAFIQRAVQHIAQPVLGDVDTIARMDKQIAKEKAKAEHLTLVLFAAQKLREAKTNVSTLEQQISTLNKEPIPEKQPSGTPHPSEEARISGPAKKQIRPARISGRA